jgi:hypothetical protein
MTWHGMAYGLDRKEKERDFGTEIQRNNDSPTAFWVIYAVDPSS